VFGAGSTGRPEHTAPSRNKPYAMLEYNTKRQTKKSVFDSNLFRSDSNLFRSDPNLFRSDPNLLRSDPNLFRSDPNLFRSDSNLLRSDPNLFRSEPNLLRSDPNLFRSEPNLFRSEPDFPAPAALQTSGAALFTVSTPPLRRATLFLSIFKEVLFMYYYPRRLPSERLRIVPAAGTCNSPITAQPAAGAAMEWSPPRPPADWGNRTPARRLPASGPHKSYWAILQPLLPRRNNSKRPVC
jgi:hypothetical protein